MRAPGNHIVCSWSQVRIVGYKSPAGARAGVRQGTLAATRYAAQQHAGLPMPRRNHAGRVQANEVHRVERGEHQALQKLVAKPLWPIEHGAAAVQAGSMIANGELGPRKGIAKQRKSARAGLIGWLGG